MIWIFLKQLAREEGYYIKSIWIIKANINQLWRFSGDLHEINGSRSSVFDWVGIHLPESLCHKLIALLEV